MWVINGKFSEISKNTFFTKHLWTTASICLTAWDSWWEYFVVLQLDGWEDRPVETRVGGDGELQPPPPFQIFAKVDLLPIDNDSEKK